MGLSFDIKMMAGRKKTNNPEEEVKTGVKTKVRISTKKPSMYRVILLNDDFTPMDFVVYLLETLFSKTREEATEIMLNVHKRGVGVCGVYTYEIAETKATQVVDISRKNQHPLQCKVEKD